MTRSQMRVREGLRMDRASWITHLKGTTGLTNPSDSKQVDLWRKAHANHLQVGCKDCLARKRTRKHNQAQKERYQCMKNLGLVRCVVHGKTYWEQDND